MSAKAPDREGGRREFGGWAEWPDNSPHREGRRAAHRGAGAVPDGGLRLASAVAVSRNGGGDDSFARRIARRFAAAPTLPYSKRPGDAVGAESQEIMLQPSGRPAFTGPVYLITSHRTASAAEVFVMSMRALPNVVHLGGTTEGSLSDILSRRLPNGWVINLSNEVYLDPEGILWEGRGVPPEVPLAISGSHRPTRKDREAVRDLVRHVQAHAAGREAGGR